MLYNELLNIITKLLIDSYHSNNQIYENIYCDEQLLQQLLEYLETYNYPVECFDLHFPVSKYLNIMRKNIVAQLSRQKSKIFIMN